MAQPLRTPVWGRLRLAVYRAVTAPVRLFVARDVFISYSRIDASTYAEALANALASLSPPVSCFIDQWHADPGRTIPRRVLRAARWSRALVVLATPGSLKSTGVDAEIDTFNQLRGQTFIVAPPGGSIASAYWRRRFPGLVPITEPGLKAFSAGTPSPEVVRRIAAACTFWRQSRRISWASAAGAAAVLVAAVVSAYFGRSASQSVEELRRVNVQMKELSKARDALGQQVTSLRHEQAELATEIDLTAFRGFMETARAERPMDSVNTDSLVDSFRSKPDNRSRYIALLQDAARSTRESLKARAAFLYVLHTVDPDNSEWMRRLIDLTSQALVRVRTVHVHGDEEERARQAHEDHKVEGGSRSRFDIALTSAGVPVQVPPDAETFIRALAGRRFTDAERATFCREFVRFLSGAPKGEDFDADRTTAIYDALDTMTGQGFRLHEVDFETFRTLLGVALSADGAWWLQKAAVLAPPVALGDALSMRGVGPNGASVRWEQIARRYPHCELCKSWLHPNGSPAAWMFDHKRELDHWQRLDGSPQMVRTLSLMMRPR